MTKKIRILAASLVVLLLAAGSLSAAHLAGVSLFGVTFFGNQLVTVNPATGVATVVGNLGESTFATGLGSSNGRLYLFDQVNDRLREVNKVSGKITRSVNVGVPDLKGEGALAFRSDGVGFLASPLNANNEPVNDFYMITLLADGSAGTSVRIGSTPFPIDAMAFNSQGTLYALAQGGDQLYTINTATGAATAVGALGAGIKLNSPVSGMASAPATPAGLEELYASIDDRLFIINPMTGAARVANTDIQNFGASISSVSGLVFAPGAGTVGNMSTRANVGTGENVTIGGFIVRGSAAKRIVIRGLGPSVRGVTGNLADPILTVFNSQGVQLEENDDFSMSPNMAAIRDLGLAPSDNKESAILRTFMETSYTAVLRGKNNTTGIGLVELYDVDLGSAGSLANLSTRGFVQPGVNSLIGGVIVSGSASQRIVFRALGPDLANRGVSNVLADPRIEIFDRNGMSLKVNDDFASDSNAAEIARLNLAPNNAKEAATLLDLAPGEYTAIVTGSGTGTGVSLVESYNVTGMSPAP